MLASSLFAGLAILPTAWTQFVSAPTDLKSKRGYAGVDVRYKQVPAGVCELDPKVKSFSGYADVAPDQHIFFWFFETRNGDPKKAPLTVWINGGPGSSSMIGLWQELGPCGVDSDGKVYNNPYSWSNASNMLFIDQPVGTGFSYGQLIDGYVGAKMYPIALPKGQCPDYADSTGTCGTYSSNNPSLTANSTVNAAPNMWKTLQGFMGAFPDYSRNDFHFTTESYGGHYGPIFNEYFEEQNAKKIAGAHPISLKSVAIGNGWYDPLIQLEAYYNFTVSPGNTYDYRPYNKSTEALVYNAMYGKGNCYDQVTFCNQNGGNAVCSLTDELCAQNVEAILDNVANRDEYDIRELTPDPFPYGFYPDYLNRADIQKAIGAYVNYTDSSTVVGNTFANTGDDSREEGVIEAIKKLLSQGVAVSLYAGDADYNCNWLGSQEIAKRIGWRDYDKAGYAKVVNSDGVTHAEVKQAGLFSFTRVYYSGHEVPFYQPLFSLEMFERVLAGKDLATGKVDAGPGYVSKGPAESTFREGNATVQYSVLPRNSTYNGTTGAPNQRRGLADLGASNFRQEKPIRRPRSNVRRGGAARAMRHWEL